MFKRSWVVGCVSIVVALAGALQAQTQQVPEVDPGSMGTALVLLAAGGALIADQVRRRLKMK